MKPARYKALFEHGCVCCRQLGWYGIPDIHHLVDRGNRAASGGDDATLPLCLWHHRGYPPEGFNITSATEAFGPSLANGSKPFTARWGSQRELLASLDATIGEEAKTIPRATRNHAAATGRSPSDLDPVGTRQRHGLAARRKAPAAHGLPNVRGKRPSRAT